MGDTTLCDTLAAPNFVQYIKTLGVKLQA